MKLVTLIAVVSLAPLLAQGTLSEHYDTSKRVSFAGTVDAVIMPPGELPVCFLMTVQNSGKSEQWVVAGDALPVLRKAGWRFGPAGQVSPALGGDRSRRRLRGGRYESETSEPLQFKRLASPYSGEFSACVHLQRFLLRRRTQHVANGQRFQLWIGSRAHSRGSAGEIVVRPAQLHVRPKQQPIRS